MKNFLFRSNDGIRNYSINKIKQFLVNTTKNVYGYIFNSISHENFNGRNIIKNLLEFLSNIYLIKDV